MILICATVRPFTLEPLRRVIADLGVQGVTVTEVHRQCGHRDGPDAALAGGHGPTDRSLARIEIAVDDSIGEPVIEAICNLARTGRPGDGEIWVLGLRDVLRIRTGDRGRDAL